MKSRASKLDAHAEQLREWDGLSVPLAEMASRLKALGCSVSLSRLSSFLEAQRSAALQARLLGQITTGSRAIKEVEAQFAKTDAPALESLVKLHRVLIMQLATQASADPAMIELVTGAMKPVLEFAKLELKGREFALDQEKFALLKAKAEQADAAKQVTDSNLSPEEKQLKMKEIFGLA